VSPIKNILISYKGSNQLKMADVNLGYDNVRHPGLGDVSLPRGLCLLPSIGLVEDVRLLCRFLLFDVPKKEMSKLTLDDNILHNR